MADQRGDFSKPPDWDKIPLHIADKKRALHPKDELDRAIAGMELDSFMVEFDEDGSKWVKAMYRQPSE